MNYSELIALLKTSKEAEELETKKEEIFELIPKLKEADGIETNQYGQVHPLLKHMFVTVANLPENIEDDNVYLAALLHDIGKTAVKSTVDKKHEGKVEYNGHEKESMKVIKNEIIHSLNENGAGITNHDIDNILFYVENHDEIPGNMKRYVKKMLMKGTYQTLENLMKLQIANAKAQGMYSKTKDWVETCEYVIDKIENDPAVLVGGFSSWAF